MNLEDKIIDRGEHYLTADEMKEKIIEDLRKAGASEGTIAAVKNATDKPKLKRAKKMALEEIASLMHDKAHFYNNNDITR